MNVDYSKFENVPGLVKFRDRYFDPISIEDIRFYIRPLIRANDGSIHTEGAWASYNQHYNDNYVGYKSEYRGQKGTIINVPTLQISLISGTYDLESTHAEFIQFTKDLGKAKIELNSEFVKQSKGFVAKEVKREAERKAAVDAAAAI